MRTARPLDVMRKSRAGSEPADTQTPWDANNPSTPRGTATPVCVRSRPSEIGVESDVAGSTRSSPLSVPTQSDPSPYASEVADVPTPETCVASVRGSIRDTVPSLLLSDQTAAGPTASADGVPAR